MSSLKQLVSEIVHIVGDPNSVPLQRQVRQEIIHVRNQLIRQSFNNHGYIDKQLWQRYKVSLIDVPESDIIGVNIGQKVKRSAQKVLKPVRFTDNLPFKSVRTLGSFPLEIAHVKQAGGQFYSSLPGMCQMPLYDLINHYIYINYTNARIDLANIKYIIIEAPFEYPHLVPEETYEGSIVADDLYHENNDGNAGDYASHSHFDDDDEFLLPEDMIPTLKDIILKHVTINPPHEDNTHPKANTINQLQ